MQYYHVIKSSYKSINNSVRYGENLLPSDFCSSVQKSKMRQSTLSCTAPTDERGWAAPRASDAWLHTHRRGGLRRKASVPGTTLLPTASGGSPRLKGDCQKSFFFRASRVCLSSKPYCNSTVFNRPASTALANRTLLGLSSSPWATLSSPVHASAADGVSWEAYDKS